MRVNDFCIPNEGCFVGRVYLKDIGPTIIAIKHQTAYNITSKKTPTIRDLLELDNPANYVKEQLTYADTIGSLDDISKSSWQASSSQNLTYLLSPCDLQAIKACGVTFAKSMIERVIEEQARGDSSKSLAIRETISKAIGSSLSGIVPGSEQALHVKSVLKKENFWSQYLEVGIGKDAEVFTKSQPLSSVGWGADIGIHPISDWNNPEPEIVLAVNSRGIITGATLGNDVNLRDIEGRSALLLGKAKDNNASAAIGPFIRLFDESFTLENINQLTVDLCIQGEDGFSLKGQSSMSEISRSPTDLVRQTIGSHHQYPDGFMLYLGTMFSPTKDRNEKKQGFTHHINDIVTISNDKLGTLTNTVKYSTDCPKWEFGIQSLMKNLAKRKLL